MVDWGPAGRFLPPGSPKGSIERMDDCSANRTDPLPDELLELIASKFRMLADPTRLAILRALMAGERNVGQVVKETGRGQANVSKHLKLLAASGLLARRKEALQVFYRLNDPMVEQVCSLVCATILKDLREQVEENGRLLNHTHVGP